MFNLLFKSLFLKKQQHPSPLTGEGQGGGDSSDLIPPHLNPLPPGERRLFPIVIV
jgi:hypothetical protein